LPDHYPWYLPAVVLATLPAQAAVFDLMTSRRPRLAVLGWLPVIIIAILAIDYSLQARVSEQVVERQRREIGLWLAQEAAPEDRVFLECVGRIGFYAQRKMLDWPGLVAPEVIEARRRVGDNMALVGEALEPEWLVLRPREVNHFDEVTPRFLSDRYTVVRTFDVTSQLQARAHRNPELLLYDAVFFVMRHR
jgi:hypothetical protein